MTPSEQIEKLRAELRKRDAVIAKLNRRLQQLAQEKQRSSQQPVK